MSEYQQNVSRVKRHSRKKRRKRKAGVTFISWFLLLFMISTITLFGYGYWKFDNAILNISETPQSNKANAQSEAQPPSLVMGNGEQPDKDQPFGIAVIGTDRRNGSGGSLNADVMMVAVVDPENLEVQLLSIPRDTKVRIPGYSGYRKANAAFALGEMKKRAQERNNQEITESGTALIKEMLSEYLDIPIHYHVHIGFTGFEEVVDALEGIEVDVKRSMLYEDPIDGTSINISKGRQVLDGKNALDYVRFRLDSRGEQYNSNDFERNERQQEVIHALVDRLTSVHGLLRIPTIIDVITDHVSTDLSPEQIKEYVVKFKSFSPSQMTTLENEAYWDSTQGFTIIPEQRLEQIKRELKTALQLNE